MKIHCSSLRCPHCGSKDFNLIKGDIFLCEYCRGKFNFDLDEVDFSSENKVFLDELRIAFTKKMNEKYGRIPYKFLSDFSGYKSDIHVRCKDCGFEFRTIASNLLTPTKNNHHPCRKCIENLKLARMVKMTLKI